MLSSRGMTRKSFLILHLTTIILKKEYSFPPTVDAMNGVIWTKNASDFVHIFSIRSFDIINKERISISRKLETHDFNGIQLRFSSFPITDLVNFVSNDTLATGVHGDTWQILANMLNFKIRYIKLRDREYGIRSENGSWNGMMGHISRNETDIIPRTVVFPSRATALDFTLGTWITGHRFYMKKQLQYHRTWMAELFSPKLWYSIVGIYLALVSASCMIDALNHTNNNQDSCIISDHFFYVFAIFCNQGWIPKPLEKRSKILTISTCFFSWLLFIAFSSKLISHTTQRDFHPPFNDLESFYEHTNYKLVVQRHSFVYSVFTSAPRPIYTKILDSGRLIQANVTEAYKMICEGGHVYFEVQDAVEATAFNGCEINFLGKSYFSTWIAGGLIRGFKYRKSIDAGMLKLHEFGLINRLRLKWLIKTTSMKSTVETQSIEFEHVSLIIAMLFHGMILSLFVLLIENIVQFTHRRQN